jgi:osmotically-inducible protein OsmY
MFTDNQLRESVQAELSWEPSITSAHIGVTASAGVVTLTGHVGSFVEKHAVEMAARRVKDVKAVADEIEVRLPFETKRGDDEIAAAAIARLAWDVSIPPDAVKVTVENGWLTLTGQVEWYYQKLAATQNLRPLMGVVGISDRTTIKPRIDTLNVRDDIMHALHRSWFFDPKTISVSAEGGEIRLTGHVASIHERQLAAATAWAAPGATSVENDITVN